MEASKLLLPQRPVRHFVAFALVFFGGLIAASLLGWVLDSGFLFLWPQFVLATNGATSLLNDQLLLSSGYTFTIAAISWILIGIALSYLMRRRSVLVTLLATYPIIFLVTAIVWLALNALGVGTPLAGP